MPELLDITSTGAAASDQRAARRYSVIKGARILFDSTAIDCVLLNVSESGALVYTDAAATIPDHVTLQFAGDAIYQATRRWTRGTEIGFSLDSATAFPPDTTETARNIYDMMCAATLAEPIRLLRAKRFFGDVTLQVAAEEAEAAMQRLRSALGMRARNPSFLVTSE